MNFKKMSFRPTEHERLYLDETAKSYSIENPTQLLQKIVDDHMDWNMGSSRKLVSSVDNIDKTVRVRSSLQKNGVGDAIVPQDGPSPARVDKNNVYKRSFVRKSGRTQKPILMRTREDGYYHVDNARNQTDWMSTAFGDTELVTNERKALLMRQIMWMQMQAAIALANQLQQMSQQYNPPWLSYNPPFGYPMMYNMPQRSRMDSMDICLESLEKGIKFKNLCDAVRKW